MAIPIIYDISTIIPASCKRNIQTIMFAPGEIVCPPHLDVKRRKLLLSTVCLSDPPRPQPGPLSLVMGARQGLKSVLCREGGISIP